MEETVNVTDFRKNISDLFDDVAQGHSVLIERNNKTAGVLISPEMYERLKQNQEEMLAELSSVQEEAEDRLGEVSDEEAVEIALEAEDETESNTSK